MEFDIFRYVLIFLTYFGHNLGTIPHRLFQIEAKSLYDMKSSTPMPVKARSGR